MRTQTKIEYSLPERPRPAGAPNVVVVLLDDVGFAQLGCFGSTIRTPNIDRLAGQGMRYNRFHVTALCSPSRASLLTGRNHHAVGMGFLGDMPIGYPGYSGRIPRSAATVARVLRDEGWNTFAVGKWHLTPRADRSASGPFDTWPLGQGFEKYYGFLHGDANHWTPNLYRDQTQVEPPRSPEEGYHLTDDLVDEAIRYINDQHHATPEKPFFLYFAPGAGHAPHQVEQTWSDAYTGEFDAGWDVWRRQIFERQRELGVVPEGTKLPERPPWIQDWETLSQDERRLFARFQEVFAGFMTHFDSALGRLLDELEELGIADNTMVILTSDNGASAEGGSVGSINEHRFAFSSPDSLQDNLDAIDEIGGHRAYNHYPWGWAWAGNTPFHLWKRYSWLGGTRTPLIVKPPSPEATHAGTVREHVAHIVDLYSTILDVCGVEAPTVVDGVQQQALPSRSLVPTLDDPETPAIRPTQYFEMLGSRSIIHDGWKATTDHISQGVPDEAQIPGSRDFETDHWGLYRMDDDFCEANDVSADHPDVVAKLEEQWWKEAEANNVLPLDDTMIRRLIAMEPELWPMPANVVIRPGFSPIADEIVPSLNGGALLVADVDVPAGGAEGILAALGDWNNGWALAVIEGRLCFLLNLASTSYEVRADQDVPAGRHRLGFSFDNGALVREPSGVLFLDGAEIARGLLPQGLGASGIQIGGGGLRVAYDAGFPVSEVYRPPFEWSGTFHSLTISSDPGKPFGTVELAEILRRE